MQTTIDIIRIRSISIARSSSNMQRRGTPLSAPAEARMEHEQATRLPQTTTAIQGRRAAHTDDLHRLILAGQAWIDGYQAINAEMLAFWQSRIKAGLGVGGQLLECTSADSTLEVQLDYAKAAMQAYLDQSARTTGLLMRALSAGFVELAAATSKGQTRALAA